VGILSYEKKTEVETKAIKKDNTTRSKYEMNLKLTSVYQQVYQQGVDQLLGDVGKDE
jgi:hypothetical protein